MNMDWIVLLQALVLASALYYTTINITALINAVVNIARGKPHRFVPTHGMMALLWALFWYLGQFR